MVHTFSACERRIFFPNCSRCAASVEVVISVHQSISCRMSGGGTSPCSPELMYQVAHVTQ